MKNAAKRQNAFIFPNPEPGMSFLSAFILPHMLFNALPIVIFAFFHFHPEHIYWILTFHIFLMPLLVGSWIYSAVILIVIVIYLGIRAYAKKLIIGDIGFAVFYAVTVIGYMGLAWINFAR